MIPEPGFNRGFGVGFVLGSIFATFIIFILFFHG
jgi:hypothetical protein